MSKRQQISRHIESLKEIKDIMSSMKTLSMLELRKLNKLMLNQERVVNNIEQIATDFLTFYPFPVSIVSREKSCLLVIGSERGFCGDFNDKLRLAMNEAIAKTDSDIDSVIAVGQKLCSHLVDHPKVIARLDGVSVADEAAGVIQTVLDIFQDLQNNKAYSSLLVMYIQHEKKIVDVFSLIPPFVNVKSSLNNRDYPPELNMLPDRFISMLVEQYLFSRLHEIFFSSVMTENNERVRHLESALERIDQNIDEMTKKSSILRQEEITEEIEIILLSSQSLQKKRSSNKKKRIDIDKREGI